MTTPIYEALNINSQISIIIISVTFMLFGGFAMTRLTKRLRLPNVTAYILAGIIIGPFCFNLVPSDIIQGMGFLADIALAFIAFNTGEFLRFKSFKKNGGKVVVITLFESLFASLVVFIAMYFILRLPMSFALVLAALASATAPASTLMTIKQTGAKGSFVDTLIQVVALDDIVGLLAYSIAMAIATGSITGAYNMSSVGLPILWNILIFGLGIIFGFLLKFLLNNRSKDNRLIVTTAMIFAFCGICAILDVSPLLGCMAMGMIYINTTEDEKLFKQMDYFTPVIFLLFFVRSGANFNLSALVSDSGALAGVSLLTIGITYFIVRIGGKYIGSFLGCIVTGSEKRIRNYLGLALIPQAGVAIGLAAMGARILPRGMGMVLETIILSSSILYELIGPACGKLSLYLSKSYSNNIDDMVPVDEKDADEEKLSDVEILIKQIQEIQRELPTHDEYIAEAEAAFSKAADEQYIEVGEELRDKVFNRRKTNE